MKEIARPAWFIHDFVPGVTRLGDPVEQPMLPPATNVPREQLPTAAAPEVANERVKLSGYLGATPRFTVLASGNLRVRFPLAEHHEDGKTTWHNVYATDKPDSKRRYASRLKDKGLEKGMFVEVAGERQVRHVQQPDGTTKRTEAIYCYGVRLLGGQQPPSEGEPETKR